MTYDKTINDIIDYTGLKYEYIIKCIKELDEVLKPYVQRGDKNSLIFDSNALQIFDRIKQLKDGKQSITSIKIQLKSELNKTQKQTGNTTSNLINDTKNIPESDVTKTLITKLEEANKKAFESLEKVLESKNEVIEVQRRENQELKNQILLITDGRNEQVRGEQLAKEKELLEKDSRLVYAESRILEKDTLIEQLKKQEEDLKKTDIEKALILLEREEKLKNMEMTITTKETELVHIKSEQEKKDQENKLKEERRKNILLELEQIDGKWFVGTQRKQLLKELQNLL